MKHKQTVACSIPPHVKVAVYERDGCECVSCHKWVDVQHANAHFVPRSHGGLGVEQNILTLCTECHRTFDQTVMRAAMQERFRAYLQSKYPEWDEQALYYRKYGGVN